VYEITFSTRTVVIENYQPPAFPLFIHGTAQEEAGVTAVQVGGEDGINSVLLTFAGSPGVIGLPHGNISALIVKSQNLAITYNAGTDYSLDKRQRNHHADCKRDDSERSNGRGQLRLQRRSDGPGQRRQRAVRSEQLRVSCHSDRSVIPNGVEGSRLVREARGTSLAWRFCFNRQPANAWAFSCAPQTARDPSASVGMTDPLRMTDRQRGKE
jgi:hypothetical protein